MFQSLGLARRVCSRTTSGGTERRIGSRMAVVYSIRNWKERFEVAQAKAVKSWSWVAIPNKHDGLGFRRIMALPDGMVVYAAWCLMVQMASKCPKRGVLADENGPLDASDLALKTGGPQAAFERALSALSDKRIGWILIDDYEHKDSAPPLQNRTEQDTTEHNKTQPSAPLFVFVDLPPTLDVPEFRTAWQLWEQHRKEKRQKLTPTATKQQLKELSEWGVSRAIAAIEHSIRKGWIGLFEENANGRTSKLRPGSQPATTGNRGL